MEMSKSELAFEEGFPEGEPHDLWRLCSARSFKEREIRHVNWFASLEAAREHVAWIEDGRGKVVSLTHYRNV
jgi:hypothetical protein